MVLVGCMHYNPTSIGLASSVVREEAASKRLRACVVESCPTRWNSTLQIQPKGSLLRAICDNEMQAAAEVAEEFGRPVELGDQTIEDTGRRITQLLALTFVQLLTPAGWQAIYADVSRRASAPTTRSNVTAFRFLRSSRRPLPADARGLDDRLLRGRGDRDNAQVHLPRLPTVCRRQHGGGCGCAHWPCWLVDS